MTKYQELLVASLLLLAGLHSVSSEIAIMHYGHFGGLSITCKRDELILMESELLGYSTNSDCNPKPLCSVPYTLAKWYCRGKSTCGGMQVERRPLHKRTCGNDFTNCLRVEYKCIKMQKLTDVCSDTIYEAQYGYISSPSFPEMYPPDKNCTCSLTAAPNEHVRVYSAFFLLKSNTPCNDWVSLTVDSESNRKCGYIPEPKFYVGQKVKINFRSDESDTEMGFWFKFSGTSEAPVAVRCGRYAFMDSKVSPTRTEIETTTPQTSTTTTTTTTTTITTTTTATPTTVLTTTLKEMYEKYNLTKPESKYAKQTATVEPLTTIQNDPFHEEDTKYREFDEDEFLKQWVGTTAPTAYNLSSINSDKMYVVKSPQTISVTTKTDPRSGSVENLYEDNNEVDETDYQKTDVNLEEFDGDKSDWYARPTPQPYHTKEPRSTAEPAMETFGNIREDNVHSNHRDQYNTLGLEVGGHSLKIEVLPTHPAAEPVTQARVDDNMIHHVHTVKDNPTTSLPMQDNHQEENYHDIQLDVTKQYPHYTDEKTAKHYKIKMPFEDMDNTASEDYVEFIHTTPEAVVEGHLGYAQSLKPVENHYQEIQNEELGKERDETETVYETPINVFDAIAEGKKPKRFEDVVSKVNEIKQSLKFLQNEKDQKQTEPTHYKIKKDEKHVDNTFQSDTVPVDNAYNTFDNTEEPMFSKLNGYKQTTRLISTVEEGPYVREAKTIYGDAYEYQEPQVDRNGITITDEYEYTQRLNSQLENAYDPQPRSDYSNGENYIQEKQHSNRLEENQVETRQSYENGPVVLPGVTEKYVSREKAEHLHKVTEAPIHRVSDFDLRHHVHSVPWNSFATGEFKTAVKHLALVDETSRPSTTSTTTNHPHRTAEVVTLKGSLENYGVVHGGDTHKYPAVKLQVKDPLDGIEFSNSEPYGVIQTKVLRRKTTQSATANTNTASTYGSLDFVTKPAAKTLKNTVVNDTLSSRTMSPTDMVAIITNHRPIGDGSSGSLPSATDLMPAKSTDKKSGTVWVLLVIAVIGWIIFMAFLGLVLYYRRDRLPCRQSFERMDNSSQGKTLPKQFVLPSLTGTLPFGLRVPGQANASTQTRRKHAIPLFSSDGESSRSSTSLGSHLMSPSMTSTPTPTHTPCSPIRHRPLPPVPPPSRPPPPPPSHPPTPSSHSLGIQTTPNSNMCTQTEQSNSSQTDLTLILNPFESITKAIGRRCSFREVQSQPQTPIRERYPPGHYAELPKKKQFATINASALSALNNLNHSNISSWAIHRIPSLNPDKGKPRLPIRRSSSKQSRSSYRSISPQVSFSLPGDKNQHDDITDLSTPALKRARSNSSGLSRTSVSQNINPHNVAKSHHIRHQRSHSSGKHPHRDPSPHIKHGHTDKLNILPLQNKHSASNTKPPARHDPQSIHNGRIHKLSSPPLKPGPFRPNPKIPSPTSTDYNSVKSNDFPPPPPEIMLNDPPSDIPLSKKRIPIPYQQISTAFTQQKQSPVPGPQAHQRPEKVSSPNPGPSISSSYPVSSKTTYALPIKPVQKPAESPQPGPSNTKLNKTEKASGQRSKTSSESSYTDFYFSGDCKTPLVFNNCDGRTSTSSSGSSAPDLPPKHFTPMASFRRNPPTPPPLPDNQTLSRQASHSTIRTQQSVSGDEANTSADKDVDQKHSSSMDLQRIGPIGSDNGKSSNASSPRSNNKDNLNTTEKRNRDRSTERVRKLVPQQAYMFHDAVQPELQAILNKRRTQSEPVEV